MSAVGPLCAIGFALFFAGLYISLTSRRWFDSLALMAIGVASQCMAYELLSKSL